MSSFIPKDFARHYSDPGLWKKLGRFAAYAGREVVEKVLLLYFAAVDPATPARARGIAWSALGYFILPADVIPDLVPGVGFSDDLGAAVLALGVIAAHIKPAHKAAARKKLHDWFGPRMPTEESDVPTI